MTLIKHMKQSSNIFLLLTTGPSSVLYLQTTVLVNQAIRSLNPGRARHAPPQDTEFQVEREPGEGV